MEILIRTTPHDVALQAADILEYYVRRGATLGLATGSTPNPTYQELIRRHREEGLTFAECQAFLLDEYYGLPREHEQSYYTTIRREFTSHVDIADAAVHSPEGTNPDYDKAATDYDRSISEAGGVDIQILGVGTNGHIGFNEPSSSLNSLTRIKTLHPQTVKDNARFFDSEDDVPRHVLTQGLGTIQRARHLLLLATGEGKADAVQALAEGPVSASCPGSILQWHRHATVIVDEAAASKLANTEYYRYTDANKPAGQAH
ncbi:MAG: glucosamine-6-phosphate deaminase [Corynebacterium sp.]|nr:glucosamine-6-phosphate deaminase [Corynebacterium sp.]